MWRRYFEVVAHNKMMIQKTSKEFYTEMGVDWLSERKNVDQTKKELSYIIQLLKKDWKILDLACGYGRFAIPLASNGFRVEGIDITPVFIERAKEEAKKRNLNIEFKVGNMTDLPYDDDSFDAVICMWNAFSELAREQEQLNAILEIYRVLKKDGLAFVEVRNHRSNGLVEANAIDGYEAMPSYNHNRASMRRLMKLSQLENYEIFIDNFGGRNRLILKIHKP